MTDLKPLISVDQSELLNATKGLPEALGRGLIESDADAELLFHLEFKQAVSVSEVVLFGGAGQNLPSEVRLYSGFLSFDQARQLRPAVSQKCQWTSGVSKLSVPLNQLRSLG